MTTDPSDLFAAVAVLAAVVFGFGDWRASRSRSLVGFVLLALAARAAARGISGVSPVGTELLFILLIAAMHLGGSLLFARNGRAANAPEEE